jgi:DNA-binding CsgD family transcriptional regulator
MTFDNVARDMIDRWISSDNAKPADIYDGVKSKLTMNMRLSVIDTSKPDAEDWVLQTIQHSKIAARLLNLDMLFRGGRLGDFKDQAYLSAAVFPQYRLVMEKGQPVLDVVQTRLAGIKVTYDRIILPERVTARPSWLVTCTYGRFMATTPLQELTLDDRDVTILLHLMAGETAKEIAHQLSLSTRTIEHRLERLRRQIGARSLPHLVTMLITEGFDRRLNFAVTPVHSES